MARAEAPELLTAESDSSSPSPQDLLSDEVLKILYLILGAGTLFAYNVFMSCADYFDAINPTEENVAGEMATYQLTSMFIVTLILLPFSTSKTRSNDHDVFVTTGSTRANVCIRKELFFRLIDIYSPARRVLYGFSFTFLFLLAYLLLPPSAMTGSILNLFSTFVGIADAFSQSGLYVLAANYGKPTLTVAATLGGAISGFVAGLLRLATRGVFDTDSVSGLRSGADLLIGLALGYSMVLIGAIIVVKKDLEKRQLRELEDIEIEGHLHSRGLHVNMTQQAKSAKFQELRATYCSAFSLTWKPIVSAFLNFFITLALFPGVTLDFLSTVGNFSLGNWLPVVLISTFNGGDCIGRYILGSESNILYRLLMTRVDRESQIFIERIGGVELSVGEDVMNESEQSMSEGPEYAGHRTLKYYNRLVWWPTFARTIFFPLFAMCTTNNPTIAPDSLRCALVFVFGVSNGFIHCSNFTVAPTLVDTEEQKNAVSMLLLLAIYSGLCLGAFFGLLVEKVIRDISR